MRKFVLIVISATAVLNAARGKVADGFPAGQSTPEGAACDFARAFITKNPSLFRTVALKPYGPDRYEKAVSDIAKTITQERAKKVPSPGGPKEIVKCFAARHLTKDGPVSYGYSMFSFKDIMFVDVQTKSVNGQIGLNRTLVIQDEKGKWFVHPAPSISPLLSTGLNDEPPSKQEFKKI